MKSTKLIILFLFISCLLGAKGIYSKGDAFYNKGNYYSALESYKAISSDGEDDVLTQIKIARCYYQLNMMQNAYKTYYDYRNVLNGKDIYMFASSLNKSGNYKEAIKWYYEVPKDLADSLNVKELINSCRWAMRTTTSVQVELNSTRLSDLGQSFGIQYYKNGVVFSAPEETKQKKKRIDNHGYGFQNLFYSDLENNDIAATQKKFSSKLKFPYHIGAISFSPGYTKIYYTKTLQIKNKSVLKIFTSSYDENTNDWIDETELPFNSDLYNCAHPSVSPDNKFLYFTSDMPNGYGGKDLYRVMILGENKYGTHQNLGLSINTFGDEMFPFVSSDDFLYFSSNGHPGFGSLDVFKASYIKNDNTWNVTNLMLPINSSYDDFAYIINPNATNTGFISSDRGNVTDVIYSITSIKKAPIKFATYLENANTGSPIEDGLVIIEDANTGRVIGETVSDKFGAFEILIPEEYRDKEHSLIIKATQTNYEPKALNVVASMIQDLNNRRIPLKPLNDDLPKSLFITLVDVFDRSPIANRKVTLKDKSTNEFIGQSLSNSFGEVNIDIPNKYRKSDQDFNVEVPEGDGYLGKSFTVSMAELDYIKDKGIEMLPDKTAMPENFSAVVTNIVDNKPIPNAKINIREIKKGELVGTITTNVAGFFSLQIPEKYKKEGTVFNIEVVNVPGFYDEKIDVSIYNIRKLRDRGIELKPVDKFADESKRKLKSTGPVTISISDVRKGTDKFLFDSNNPNNSYQRNLMLSSTESNKNMIADELEIDVKILNEIKNMVVLHDKNEISKESYSTLDKLADYMKNNPKMIIKINGHTDVRGTKNENFISSQKIADAAKKYLVSKGIISGNIISRGYGDRYTINKCQECSLDEHLQNDRVEVVVLRILK